MEVSESEKILDGESEKIFDSFNLNPQLFLHEVLNAVDDVVDGAFEFYQQQALEILGNTNEDGVNELNKCISSIRSMIQEVLDKRLGVWEKYCLRNCFTVPEGFSLPKADTSDDGLMLMDHDALSDTELDNQLDSLRTKLSMVGKESAELQKELHAMRKQSALSSSCAKSVTKVVQQCEQNSMYDMFQEMAKSASKLHAALESLKTKRKAEFECIRTERIYDLTKEGTLMNHNEGIPRFNVNDVQAFVADLKSI